MHGTCTPCYSTWTVCSSDRNGFIDAMKKENIGTGVHFTALISTSIIKRTSAIVRRLSNAEWIGERTVSLPLSAKMTETDVADVIRAVSNVIADAAKPTGLSHAV